MPFALVGLALVACTGELSFEEPDDGLLIGKGVQVGDRVIRIGAINDETGPGSAIGVPFAAGKRVLAARINAGDSGLLPDGWTVTLVEHDAASDRDRVTEAFRTLKDDVLFLGTSFGTSSTIALRDQLQKNSMVAFPASLSSEMAKHPYTPPLGASYKAEARRALDFMVDRAGGVDKLKIGIVHAEDEYGADAVSGFVAAAKQYGMPITTQLPLPTTGGDIPGTVQALDEAGVTHVMLAVLPDTTSGLLGAASQAEYAPTWVGATPAWVDTFFDDGATRAAFSNYHQANSLPYWGEDVPGMEDLAAAWKAHANGAPSGFYALLSYAQGLAAIAGAKRAIESGDLTREGYYRALTSLRAFDGGGLVRPIDLSSRPYALTEEVRILTPDFEGRTWTVAMDYARPGAPPRVRPGQEAMDDANAAHPPGEGL